MTEGEPIPSKFSRAREAGRNFVKRVLDRTAEKRIGHTTDLSPTTEQPSISYEIVKLPPTSPDIKETLKKNPRHDLSGLPDTDYGTGRMLFNLTRDGYSENHALGGIVTALRHHGGAAPLETVVKQTSLSPDEVLTRTSNLHGVFELATTKDGTHMLHSPPLQHYIEEHNLPLED